MLHVPSVTFTLPMTRRMVAMFGASLNESLDGRMYVERVER